MKKLLGIVLAFVLTFSLAACGGSGNSSQTAASAEPKTEAPSQKKAGPYQIGFSTLTTEGDFMSSLSEQLKTRFTSAGHKFEVASADLSPIKQIEQIENFISLGVDSIIIMAVDPSSLSDVIKKAQAKGIKIVAFSQKTQQYDLYLGANDADIGKTQAKMAADWIEKKYPDAAPGSVEVAILENRDKPTAAERSDGLKTVTEHTQKIKVVQTVGVDTSTKGGQAAAENLLLTHPNVKVVLAYNGDTAMGVDAYAMSKNSAIKDKANFAVFGVDFNAAAAEAIQKSINNESVWRGTILMGGSLETMYEEIVTYCIQALDGSLKSKDVFAQLSQITPENIGKFTGK